MNILITFKLTGFPRRRSPLVIEEPPATGTVENPAV